MTAAITDPRHWRTCFGVAFRRRPAHLVSSVNSDSDYYGADPNFSKGRSPTASVVTQEVVGALALVALGGAIVGCVGVARGKNVRSLLIALLPGLVLVVAWLFAYAGERAS